MIGTTVAHHHILCVIPDAKAIRRRRVQLPDINTSILFATPAALRDGHHIRGTILCHVIGEDHLDLRMTEIVQSRLRQPEHDCPGRHVDFPQLLWDSVGTEAQR